MQRTRSSRPCRSITCGLPVAALNRGRTRADELLSLKVEADCAQTLAFLLDASAPTALVQQRIATKQ